LTGVLRGVQDGVPLYDVQALLGHEDYSTTQRYAHLAPDAHNKIMESWSRRVKCRYLGDKIVPVPGRHDR